MCQAENKARQFDVLLEALAHEIHLPEKINLRQNLPTH
jgi:hypothetical protein